MAFEPPGAPMLAVTATVTDGMRRDIVQSLDVSGCKVVSVSPYKANTYYPARRRTGDIGEDLSAIILDPQCQCQGSHSLLRIF